MRWAQLQLPPQIQPACQHFVPYGSRTCTGEFTNHPRHLGLFDQGLGIFDDGVGHKRGGHLSGFAGCLFWYGESHVLQASGHSRSSREVPAEVDVSCRATIPNAGLRTSVVDMCGVLEARGS